MCLCNSPTIDKLINMDNKLNKILDLSNTGIIYNSEIDGSIEFAHHISSAFFEKNLTKSVPEIFDIKKMPENLTFAISIGGDGTILKCARHYSCLNVPVFGFNMGRLGYLSQALPNELDYVIEKIKNNDFRIEERLMLKSDAGNIALNDMVVKKEFSTRTSVFNLYINNNPVCSYMADGIIISTPTGSTAYALSAGGPVVSPDIDCFSIVPICPHTLNARPVMVNSDETITVKICSDVEGQITADGQDIKMFKKEVSIKKYENSAKLLLLNKEKQDFYRILRQKLHWGVAPHKC